MNEFSVGGHTYTPGTKIAHGDLADIYEATVDNTDVILKVCRAAGNEDLMINERLNVGALTKDNVIAPGDVPEIDAIDRIKYAAYMPRIIDSVLHDNQMINIFEPLTGLYPLSQVLADIGPMSPKDIAWAWRRTLVALGFAHRQGIVHGAVHLEHIMVEPAKHGVVLIDWCYSTPVDTPMQAAVGRYRDTQVAPEVLLRTPVTPAADIYTVTKAFMSMIDPDRCPPPIKSFARACTAEQPSRRPQDAWELKGQFDMLIDRFYERKFTPFPYPRVPATTN